MSDISFNTDKTTKQKASILAAFKGTTLDAIVKEAVDLYLGCMEGELRPIANTVRLDAETRKRLQEVQIKTQFSKSKIIHLCLQKYVEAAMEANKEKFAQIFSRVA